MKPAISIIIPVLHEAHIIDRTLERVLCLAYHGSFEVIVVDGSPERDSVQWLHRERVKTFLSAKGRSLQMNKGAAHATGEILLFLHADTQLPDNALELIAEELGRGDVVGGAFDLAIDSPRTIFRVIEKAASFRSRLTRIPYGDQALFMRKDYFLASGGFREIPLMEDVELMRRIRRAGDRIRIIRQKARTSSRRWEKEGVLFCTLRNWALITLYSFGISPVRLARFYRQTR